MKKLLNLAHEHLFDIQGSHGFLDQYSWMSANLKNDLIVVLTINKTFWEKKYLVMTRNSLLNLIISF